MLKAVCKKADLNNTIKRLQKLTKEQHRYLLNLMQKIEELFEETLGKWKTDPVDFELRENSKQTCS